MADEGGCGCVERWAGRGGVLQGGIPMAPPSGELERLGGKKEGPQGNRTEREQGGSPASLR